MKESYSAQNSERLLLGASSWKNCHFHTVYFSYSLENIRVTTTDNFSLFKKNSSLNRWNLILVLILSEWTPWTDIRKWDNTFEKFRAINVLIASVAWATSRYESINKMYRQPNYCMFSTATQNTYIPWIATPPIHVPYPLTLQTFKYFPLFRYKVAWNNKNNLPQDLRKQLTSQTRRSLKTFCSLLNVILYLAWIAWAWYSLLASVMQKVLFPRSKRWACLTI